MRGMKKRGRFIKAAELKVQNDKHDYRQDVEDVFQSIIENTIKQFIIDLKVKKLNIIICKIYYNKYNG